MNTVAREIENSGARTAQGLFDGFEAYKTPDEDDYRRVLTSGLVVPDTNVLLNLYRYNSSAQQDLLAVLERIGDQLWVPHQVLVEFWRNRESTLFERRTIAAQTVTQLDGLCSNAISSIKTWSNRIALPSERTEALREQLQACFDEIGERIKALAEELLNTDAAENAKNTNIDNVLLNLERVLRGKIGPKFEKEDYENVRHEGLRRIKEKIPPAYKDSSKDDARAIGDYVVWEQVLREAEIRRCDVMLVTGDTKEDWWRKVSGELRGPRHELSDEIRVRANSALYMLRPESLLIHARKVLDVAVREQSVQDVERVERSRSTSESAGWTREAVDEFFKRLEADSPVQAAALRLAAAQEGAVTRKQVYEIGHYDETRMLRGFTRPVKRVCQALRREGILDQDASDPIEVFYETENWSQASGFGILKEVAELMKVPNVRSEGLSGTEDENNLDQGTLQE